MSGTAELKSFEELLEAGEVAWALLLKGGWNEREVEIIRQAWIAGFQAGQAFATSSSPS